MSERSRIDLPSYVPDRFEVYVAGVRQTRGVDYEQIGRSLVFPRPLAQEGRLGFWRWASMWLGIAGTYRKHETVDVAYEAGGGRGGGTRPPPPPHEADWTPHPPPAGGPPPPPPGGKGGGGGGGR